MSSKHIDFFSKENLDDYLKELAKEYRKMGGKMMPAEIILTGGAAILANYGFRNTTTDVDAVIRAASTMKDAINAVADRLELSNGWLNADVTRTESYSPKLREHSVYYKEFYDVLSVRTISSEYLIAMKLCSGRTFKHDLSDVIGILAEHEKRGVPITYADIDKAVNNLYGGWEKIPVNSRTFMESALKADNYEKIYVTTKNNEALNSDLLERYNQEHPGVLNADNTESILNSLKSKTQDCSSLVSDKAPHQQPQKICKVTFNNRTNGNKIDVYLNIVPQNYIKGRKDFLLTPDERLSAIKKLNLRLKGEHHLNYDILSAEMVVPMQKYKQKSKTRSKTLRDKNAPR